LLTRPCPNCQGNKVESSTDRPCGVCHGTGRIEGSDEPIEYKPSTTEGVMKLDPLPDPLLKEARKKALETCGKCICCKRWKAKAHQAKEYQQSAIANAQRWAAHWKQQYELLAKAKSLDGPTPKA
jgi:RecJ-like exonuclease